VSVLIKVGRRIPLNPKRCPTLMPDGRECRAPLQPVSDGLWRCIGRQRHSVTYEAVEDRLTPVLDRQAEKAHDQMLKAERSTPKPPVR
jgi:hypothetical protein